MKISHILDDYLIDEKVGRTTGLVHSNGKVLEVDFFNHIKAAKAHPEFLTASLKEKLKNYREELQSIEAGCHRRIEEGEHPEWHVYEMAESDLNTEFLNDLYDSGYLRFYIHFKKELGQTFGSPQVYANITLEGKKIENHRDLISYLNNKYRVRLKIEKR